MAYEGYSDGADGLSEYSSFDSSARFDSSGLDSARFDSSFRAPDDFKPDHFGLDDNKEGFDDFKGASHSYDHPAPIYENEEMGGSAPGMPGIYGFGSESPSDFPQRDYSAPEYAPEYSSDPVERSYNKELDEDLFGGDGGGPMLPPPEEMQEEGQLLRQWKRENMLRLQEKERIEKEKLQQIIDDADDYKDKYRAKRDTNREAQMKANRDKELAYHADQEYFHKTAGKQYWKAVTELVPKELPASLEPKGRQMKEKEKKSTFVALPGPKPGKATDMGRFRQVLLKLKHNPPGHMNPPPPPPKPEGKEGAKVEAGKEGDKGKENSPAAEASAADSANAAEAPVAPAAPATPEQQPEQAESLMALARGL